MLWCFTVEDLEKAEKPKTVTNLAPSAPPEQPTAPTLSIPEVPVTTLVIPPAPVVIPPAPIGPPVAPIPATPTVVTAPPVLTQAAMSSALIAASHGGKGGNKGKTKTPEEIKNEAFRALTATRNRVIDILINEKFSLDAIAQAISTTADDVDAYVHRDKSQD